MQVSTVLTDGTARVLEVVLVLGTVELQVVQVQR
jgi:hypothetical protein